MIEYLQLATVVIGILAVGLPLSFAVYFWSDKNGIGRIISYMLIGETVSMVITLYFSYMSYENFYNTITPTVSMLLRWLIFATAMASTVKLVIYLKRVRDK